MACTDPWKGYRRCSGGLGVFSGRPKFAGKGLWTDTSPDPFIERMLIPCGQCLSCRIGRSQEWAVRCVHEAQMSRGQLGNERSHFLTLTYAPEHLPMDLSLSKKAWQKFRKRLGYYSGQEFKFFMCGEYGDRNLRPHYHALIFGLDLDDLTKFKRSRGKRADGEHHWLYRSETVEKAWPFGHVFIGAVNAKTAQYVSQYVLKKRTGKASDGGDSSLRRGFAGSTFSVAPEFQLMSRGGRHGRGLGHSWLERYWRDLTTSDTVVLDGKEFPVPKYYIERMAELDAEGAAQAADDLRERRRVRAAERCVGLPAREREEKLAIKERRLEASLQQRDGALH